MASIVGGARSTDAPGGRLTVPNPADLPDRGRGALGRRRDVRRRLPRRARRATGLGGVPAPVRGRAIQQLGRLVRTNKEALSQLITREIGKPIAESRGEVQEVIDTCNFFLGEGRRLYGQTVPSEMPDKQLFTFRTPVGVAAIITAGNFPVAVPSWYLVPALLCGNAVVWKPAEYTPATAEAFAQLFLHAGLPGRRRSTWCSPTGGRRSRGSSGRSKSGLVDKVGLHGLDRRRPPDRRALRAAPPVAVPRARREEPARRDARRRPRPGRRGRAVQRVRDGGPAVHVARHRDRARATSTTTSWRDSTRPSREAPIGDPTQDVLYGPMISERFLDRFLDWLELIRPHHTRAAARPAPGASPPTTRATGFVGDPDAGLFCHPTIVDGVTIGRRRSTARRRSARSWRSRRSTTFDEAMDARERARLRTVVIDLHARSAARVPVPRARHGRHGEREQLDVGRRGPPAVRRQRQERQRLRQSGIWVLDQFTRWQAMNWDYSGQLQKAQMDVADVDADLGFRLAD